MDERFEVFVANVNSMQSVYSGWGIKQRCFAARVVAATIWYLGKARAKKGFIVHHKYPRIKSAFELLVGKPLSVEEFGARFSSTYNVTEEIPADAHNKIKRYRPTKNDWETQTEKDSQNRTELSCI